MEEKLDATQVILLEWNFLDKNTIRLYFERVPLYYYSIDFSQKPDRNNVFTDYGYLELILQGAYDDFYTEGLQSFVGEDDVVIKEDSLNKIDFWDGRLDQQQDWSSGFYIKFNKKEVNYIPLELDKWKIMYQDAVLSYAEIHEEQWQSLEMKFFSWFKTITEQIITSKLPSNPSQELLNYNKWIFTELQRFEQSIRKERVKRDALLKNDNSPVLVHKNPKAKETQRKINLSILGFWEGLKKRWN